VLCFCLYIVYFLDVNHVTQSISFGEGRTILVDLNGSRVTDPNQIINLIRFTVSTQHSGLYGTLKATLAVLGLHLSRYLQGVGHPAGCEHMVNSLSTEKQNELSAFDPCVLRANLFLRVISEYEFLPLDPKFHLTVSSCRLLS
jgi:hypothetical protein